MRRTFRKTARKSLGLLFAAVMVGSMLGLPIGPAVHTASANPIGSGPLFQVPAGQLVRRAIVGEVVSKSGASMIVSTKFGNITVGLSSGTLVNAPPDKDVGIGAIQVGDKVGVLLDRSPVEPTPDPSEEDDGDGDGDTGGSTETTTDDGTTGGDTGTTTTTTDDGTIGGDTGGTTTTTDDGTTGGDTGTTTTTTDDGTTGGDTGGTTTTTDDGTTGGDTGTTVTTTDDGTSGGSSETTTDDGTGGEEGDDEPAPTLALSFRTVVATRVSIAPGKATRDHDRSVSQCKDAGVLEVIGDDGEITEVEDAECKGRGNGPDDSVLLRRKKSRDSDEFEIVGKKPTADIAVRLASLKDKLASSTADRLVLIEEREQQRAEKEQERTDRLAEKATGRAQDLVNDSEDRKGKRKRGEPVDEGDGGSSTSDDDADATDTDAGNANSGGGSNSGGGNSNSGGGSGNSGGGSGNSGGGSGNSGGGSSNSGGGNSNSGGGKGKN